jgi:VWFA-related protein
MRFSALAVASIVCVGTTVSTRPQQPTQVQAPAFRSAIDVVQLDVSVLDKNHRPVRGLTAADFTVLEDGSPQRVVAFQAFDIPDRVIPKTTWMREVAPDVATNRLFEGRLVVVVIDDLGMGRDYWTTATAARVAETILDQLGPEDLTAVVYTNVNDKAQNFTADRDRIRAAISDIKRGPSIAFGQFKGSCNPPTAAGLVLDELLRVSEALQAEPQRRKTLLFVSPGLQWRARRGRVPNDCPERLYKDLLRDAQRGNINIYGIDPGRLLGGGWQMPPMNSSFEIRLQADMRPVKADDQPSGDAPRPALVPTVMAPRVNLIGRADALDDLRTLAESTGGRAIMNTKEDNPESKVPRIFEENSSYYLLGFQSGNSTVDGKFRRLEVKVNRPDVEVRTRSGYYTGTATKPTSSKKPAAPRTPLDESVTGLLPMTDTPLRLSAAAFAAPGKPGAVVAIALGVHQPSSDRRTTEHISVLANAYDMDGKSQAFQRQTLDLEIGSNARGESRYELLARLDLPPGRYELRVGTQNAAQQRSSVYTFIDVPEFGKDPLSMSGVMLERRPALPALPKAGLSAFLPIVPTTVREFARADRVAAFLRVYQGGGGRLSSAQVAARIVNDRDEIVFEQTTPLSAERFDRNRTVDYRLDLPLTTLTAGEYLLTIEATLDKQRERRNVRFTVLTTPAIAQGRGR